MSPDRVEISVGCRNRTCVKERVEENGIPNHPSNRPAEEVNVGSGTWWAGSDRQLHD